MPDCVIVRGISPAQRRNTKNHVPPEADSRIPRRNGRVCDAKAVQRIPGSMCKPCCSQNAERPRPYCGDSEERKRAKNLKNGLARLFIPEAESNINSSRDAQENGKRYHAILRLTHGEQQGGDGTTRRSK